MLGESEVKGLMDLMSSLADAMGPARDREAKAKIALERAQGVLTETIQSRTLEIASRDEIAGAVDPRTGRTNEKWATLLTEKELSEDADVQKAIGKFNNAQEALYEAQVAVFNLSDKLGMAKATANLLAAYMNLQGGK